MLGNDDRDVASLRAHIVSGDIAALATLLSASPALVRVRIGDSDQSRTALHVATDSPGHFPRVGETIALLVAAGADVNGRFSGPHRETPLHWAASNDDIEALDALLDAGADIEADGAVLTGGTALSDAVVFAQWRAARRLVDRGAVMTIWQAAALGHLEAVTRLLGSAAPADVTNACWHACRAGQLGTARELAERGADLDWIGHDGLSPRQAGVASGDRDLAAWLASRPSRPTPADGPA